MARFPSKTTRCLQTALVLLTLSIPLTSQVAIALDDNVTCNFPFDDYCTYGGPYDEPRGSDRDHVDPDPPEPYQPVPKPVPKPDPKPTPQPVPQPAPQPSGSDIPPICLRKPSLPQCS